MLEARPGGYVYADYPDVFDAIEGDGITIEAWIYLIERPGVGAGGFHSNGNWLIVDKPGSYYVYISGRIPHVWHRAFPKGTTLLSFGLLRQPKPGWDRFVSVAMIPPEEFPLARWVHVAFQIVGEKHNTRRIGFYDRTRISAGPLGDVIGRTEAPLLIGGPKLVTFENARPWGREFESMKGYIDEVRVSEGWRYAEGAEIQQKRRFRADAKTIALWRFEERPGAPFYADSSGNDYTLVAGGSLAVHPHGKLATTWGSLKRRTQFWVRHIRRNRVYSDGRYVGKFQEE